MKKINFSQYSKATTYGAQEIFTFKNFSLIHGNSSIDEIHYLVLENIDTDSCRFYREPSEHSILRTYTNGVPRIVCLLSAGIERGHERTCIGYAGIRT